MPESTERISGYECTTHNYTCNGKAALQLHMSYYDNCSAGPISGYVPSPPLPPTPDPGESLKPVHQCKPWQQGLGAGGPYCVACGKPGPILPPKPEPDRHAMRNLILNAASLISDEGENHEYDRALIELIGNTLGIDPGDESTRDTILAMLRALND